MHPARSKVESSPERDDLRRNQPRPSTGGSSSIRHPDSDRTSSASVSPPVARRSTASSAYSIHTRAPIGTVASPGSPSGTANESPFGPAGSPQTASLAHDSIDAANIRRASRRRTGPLSASQREKAALIRKIGACIDCRRRRVASLRDKCHPSHHNMTWEEATQKYASVTPTPDVGGANNRPPSASRGSMSLMERDAQEMDIDEDSSPATPRRDSTHERTPQPPLQLHEHQREHQHEHPHEHQQHQPHRPQHRPHQHLHLQQQHHHHQQLHPQQAPQQEPPTLPPPQPQIDRKPILQPQLQSHARPHPYATSHSSQPRFHRPQQPLPSPRSPRIKTQLLSPILPPPAGVRLPAGGSGGSGSSSSGGGAVAETRLRTPLPTGRNLENLAAAALPSMQQRFPDDLQSAAARIINQANPHRSRYDAVHALLLVWSNEDDPAVLPAVEDLKALLETQYHYTVELRRIPAGAHSPYRWLLQTVMQFVNNRDLRDSLKILYYAGGSYVDREQEMVLSSVADNEQSPTIRWSGIQQVLEDASADTLVLMDAAYYPCGRMVRREGVLELLAASVGWDATQTLGRALFTRMLADELRLRHEQQQQQQQQLFRWSQAPVTALSAAELHARLVAKYHQRLQEPRVPPPEQQPQTTQQPQQHSPQQSPQHPPRPHAAGLPAPMHMQMAASARLPSILLAPCRRPGPGSPEALAAVPAAAGPAPGAGRQLTLTLRLNEDVLDKPGWTEWMRLLPEGVYDVRCEGPFAGGAAFR